MPLRIGQMAAPELAADLAEVDAGPLLPSERAEVAAFVRDRLSLAPAHLRLGIELPSILVAALPARGRVVPWLARTRAPLVSDMVKALRSLAVVHVYAGRR
jgi:hypothetical protein